MAILETNPIFPLPITKINVNHSLPLFTESGKLYTCGETDSGKLGQGDDPSNHQVAQVVHGIGGRVVTVACGGSHTVAVTGECLGNSIHQMERI